MEASTSNLALLAGAGLVGNNDETTVSLLDMLLSNPNVGLLDIGSGKVVVRRNYVNTNTVRIVSGGTSGDETAHAGFVGMGMLTAVVQGDLSCSPTVNDILQTLRELNYKHDSGILVIAQNNNPDRLHFGLAVERARSEGIPIEILIVSDDCCLVDRHQGRRGSSGIVVLNKIAGAMAEQGRSLEEIFAFCQKVHDNMSTMLYSYVGHPSSVSPGTCICARHIEGYEIDIDLHHIVTYDRLFALNGCQAVYSHMTAQNFEMDPATPVVILINNLGSSLPMDHLIFAKEFESLLQLKELPIARSYSGRLLTEPDIKGFSVTILKVCDPNLLEYLDAPSEAPAAWGKEIIKRIPTGSQERIIPVRVPPRKRSKAPGLRLQEVEANIVWLALQFACEALISCEKQLNTFDGELGSGNVGSKMKWGAEKILTEVKKKTLNYHNPGIFFGSLSVIAEEMMTGVLGVLYSIMFEAAGNYFRKLSKQHEVNVNTWLNCLDKAINALQSCVKAELGSGTMYDPLHACRTAMAEALQNTTCGVLSFQQGVVAAEEAAIQIKRNRSYPDPGAHAVGIWMRALYEGIKMKCEEQSDIPLI